MKCFSIIVVGLFAVASAFPDGAKPVGEQISQSLTEVINTAQAKIQQISADIQKQTGINPDNFQEVVKNHTTQLLSNAQTYINTVHDDIKAKAPEVEKVLVELKAKINKLTEDINTNLPSVKESTELIQKQFNEGVQTILKESNTIADAIKNNSEQVKEDVAKFTKKFVDIAVESSQNLNKQLQQASGSLADAKN